ncbi:hypothetical protein [Mycobacteroides abscessus]|uniref:hypothetical protein n=1 Tax=Mycobacteroides abscessus TaxID=36809 RepID=UPI0011A4C278|nr:hypothetical protein [Mycobacteroides abscessus]
MAPEPLFDDGPHHDGPALYTEPHFAFLNRASDPMWAQVRDVIEQWYADYPDPDGDLRARFRDVSIRQHAPAWWELYIYTLFRRLGYAPTVHPEIPGTTRHPDLLLTKDGSRVYIECVVLFEDGSRQSTDSESWVKDCIDAAKNPDFVVGVRFEHFGKLRPKQSQVTRHIEGWLATLDYDSVSAASRAGESHYPSKNFDFADSRVRLTAIPVHPDRRGNDVGRIGLGPAKGPFAVQSVGEIRDILKGKAKQCRAVDAPLIVAILNWSMFARLNEVNRALFGSAVVQSGRDTTQLVQGTDGYWHPGPPPRGSVVSAVLFGESVSHSRVAAGLPRLWRNPWAQRPLQDDLPFEAHAADPDTGEVVVTAHETIPASTVFGLSAGWPHA